MSRLFCRLCLLLLLSCNALAVIETYDFANDEQRQRYQLLTEELRCPKCQNQNLAGSDSQIAADLRRELHRLLLEGKSDEAIIDFMRERYGDFVLYKPRLQRNTWLLWFAPPALAALVILLLWWSRRDHGSSPEEEKASRPAPVEAVPVGRLSARAQTLVALLVIAVVVAGSLLLYRQFGAWQALTLSTQANQLFSGSLPESEATALRQQMLAELDALLQRQPDNDKMHYLRARLRAESRDWQRSGEDFRWLLARFADQDNLLAEYGQVLFMQNGNVLTAEATDLLKRALQFNPDNLTALGLLGMQAFEQADYVGAVRHWQRLLATLPPESRNAEAIRAGIARARELGGEPVKQLEKVAQLETAKIAVQVTVADEVKVSADTPLFVLLRAVEGPAMPLAAVKTSLSALQAAQGRVVLDLASSPMRGRLDLSTIHQVVVVARLSLSGMPQAAAGDWQGESAAMALDALPERVEVSVNRLLAQ